MGSTAQIAAGKGSTEGTGLSNHSTEPCTHVIVESATLKAVFAGGRIPL